MPELVTIPRIPLVETGVDWPASTGPVTFTSRHLYAAAEAPYSDPAVKLPRMRFGHTGAGTTPTQSAGGFEEQPCVGKFTNLRVEDEGNTLYADLAGVPKWLAEILPIAYPNRSVEAWFDVTSISTNKEHDMIITSVALLGENLPGVQTLDDLELLFSDDPGEEWITGLNAGTKVAASGPSKGGIKLPKRVAASVDTGDVRSAFYEQVAVDDRYWWWLHQIYLDPAACIAEGDAPGEYYFCAYSVQDGAVEFDEPVEVFIQWVEKESGSVAAKYKAPFLFPNAEQTFAAAAMSRPEERQKEFINKQKEAKGSVPIDIEALRGLTGLSAEDLPDDASEEQINEALAAAASKETPEEDEEPTVTEDQPVTASQRKKVLAELAQAGMTVVDATAYQATQADVSELKADKAKKEKDRRDGVVLQAVRDRKIPRAAMAHWQGLMEKDPEGTEQFLAAAAKNAVPGPPIGTDEDLGSPESQSGKTIARQGTGLFPKLDRQRAMAGRR